MNATQPLSAPPLDLLNAASLFLDFDGTVVELVARHDAVVVEARLHELLATLLAKLDGRLAIVSGRPAADLAQLFGGGATFLISGSHGLEFHWPDGRIDAPDDAPLPAGALARLHALAARHAGVVVEPKPFGAALHFRLAPGAEDECRMLVAAIADETGFAVQTGKMVVELKHPAADKGAAVRRLMREPIMTASRPIFVGDDATDESAFAAAQALGGAGILVGPERPTAASYRLNSVDDTIRWLHAAKAAL
ncbi:trehalose-phosphatase [Terricaulis sp.]|uniref:trehalose-phosphatase n=1 Tax=Terricaulis sp. TaxID=2768686 RepID=UPI0037845EA0